MKPLRLIAVWLILFSGVNTSVLRPPDLHKGRDTSAQAVIALMPDPQNMCSSLPDYLDPNNPTPAEVSEGVRQLDIEVADIVAMRPDFVIVLGDLEDQNSSLGVDANAPDNFLTNSARYGEILCFKAHVADVFDRVGIPWTFVTGNHDSYIDVERAFPRAAWILRSYHYAAENDVDRYHAGFSDTEQRAVLFTTSIGPICVVGGDWDFQTNATDQGFINTNVGCGASHPTIFATHAGPFPATGPAPPMSVAGNSEIFMAPYGHYTPTAPTPFQTAATVTGVGGWQYVDLFTNSQEASLSCGSGTHRADGKWQHTGIGYWTVVTIAPGANTIKVQARDSLRGGQSTPNVCDWIYNNATISLSPSLCTRFASMSGC